MYKVCDEREERGAGAAGWVAYLRRSVCSWGSCYASPSGFPKCWMRHGVLAEDGGGTVVVEERWWYGVINFFCMAPLLPRQEVNGQRRHVTI